jgi:hypothetical protein
MSSTEEHRHEHRQRSWADVDRDSERFHRLLAKYHGDYQQATDAYLRGEDGPPTPHGNENPM